MTSSMKDRIRTEPFFKAAFVIEISPQRNRPWYLFLKA